MSKTQKTLKRPISILCNRELHLRLENAVWLQSRLSLRKYDMCTWRRLAPSLLYIPKRTFIYLPAETSPTLIMPSKAKLWICLMKGKLESKPFFMLQFPKFISPAIYELYQIILLYLVSMLMLLPTIGLETITLGLEQIHGAHTDENQAGLS